jgi:hypothetical protein
MSMLATTDLITETLIIEKFQEEDETGNVESYEDKEDIITAYKSLPARDKRIIHETYRENFGKYGINLKMRAHCQFCGAEEDVDIDLVSNFFRMVYSV